MTSRLFLALACVLVIVRLPSLVQPMGADQGLYESKRRGQNRLTWADDLAPGLWLASVGVSHAERYDLWWHGGARTVGGQFQQGRRTGQLLLPVIQFRFQPFARQRGRDGAHPHAGMARGSESCEPQSMRELVVLGTASQVPTRERNQNGEEHDNRHQHDRSGWLATAVPRLRRHTGSRTSARGPHRPRRGGGTRRTLPALV